jgi:hypothetical protein
MKTKVNRIVFLSLLLLMGNMLVACNMLDGVKGNGDVKTEERSHSGFDKIDIGGAAEVFLTQSDEFKVVIEADENLLPIIISEVRGSTLHIYNKKNIRKAQKLHVFIHMPDLKSVELSGAVELKTEGRFEGDQLSFECSGASDLEISLKYTKITMDFSGASDADIDGYCNELSMDLSGASEINASQLEADDVSVDASGAANVKVFANKTLRADVSGAGSIRYKGDPKTDISTSGAGSIKKM